MTPIGTWMSNLKRGSTFRMANVLGKEPRLKYINVLRIENLVFPPEMDSYKTSFRLRFSATLYDTRNEIFISNSYLSPYLPVIVNDIVQFDQNEDEEDEKKSQKPNQKPAQGVKSALNNKNTGNYSHSGFWVGLVLNKDTYLKDFKLVIEIVLYQYDNLEKKMEGSKTLGYCMIDLETKLKTCVIQSGSARELLQGQYLREQRALPQYLSFEWKKSKKVTDILLKLIGPFVLFGLDDVVYGMKGNLIPVNIKDFIHSEYDQALDITFPSIIFRVNRVVEMDLLAHLIEKVAEQQKLSLKDIQAHKTDQFGIIACHNGWKTVNQTGYNNTFKLAPAEGSDRYIVYESTKDLRVDRVFPNTVVLIQLVMKIQLEVAEIKQEEVAYYIGYVVASPTQITKYQGKLKLNILGRREIFQEKEADEYYCKFAPKFAGEVELHYVQPNLSGGNNPLVGAKDDLETIQMKNQIIQMLKQSEGEATLKDKLINQSIKKKLQIKTGMAKDEAFMRQTKLINDIVEVKLNTSKIVVDMLNKGFKAQNNAQQLLHDFKGLIELGEKNFVLAKDKYTYQERKLLEYQERKRQLDKIDQQKSFMMMQSIDRWIYSQIAYPKLDVIYKQTYQDFYLAAQFGSRDVPSNRSYQLYKEDPKTRTHVKIQVALLRYRVCLKLMANTQKEDYILPSIYTFDSFCPKQIFTTVHIMGVEIMLEDGIEECQSLKAFEYGILHEFIFPLKPTATRIVPFQQFEGKVAIIEVWNADSQTVLGRCFLPLSQNSLISGNSAILLNQTKECDIVSEDGKFVIGSLDATVQIQFTDDREIVPEVQRSKLSIKSVKTKTQAQEERVKEDFQQIYAPPEYYGDVIWLFYSSSREAKLRFLNPMLLDPYALKQLKIFEVTGDPNVEFVFLEENEICIKANLPPNEPRVVYLECSDEKRTFSKAVKMTIENLQSLVYNEHVGTKARLNYPHTSALNDPIFVRSCNPYSVKCEDNYLPIVPNAPFLIPLECVSMEYEHSQTLVTIQQSHLLTHILVLFRPVENKVSELYELRCQKHVPLSQTIMYRNRTEKQLLLEITSSNPILKLETKVLQLNPFQTDKISFVLQPFTYSRKQHIKVFLQDKSIGLSDCILFKISYN